MAGPDFGSTRAASQRTCARGRRPIPRCRTCQPFAVSRSAIIRRWQRNQTVSEQKKTVLAARASFTRALYDSVNSRELMWSAYARKLSTCSDVWCESWPAAMCLRPPSPGIAWYVRPRAASAAGNVSWLNCGLVRDLGKERTSTTFLTRADRRTAINSANDRRPCPTV